MKNKRCNHRWVFNGSHYVAEPDGRFYSFYCRYDQYICEECGAHKTMTARRESARVRPKWFLDMKIKPER